MQADVLTLASTGCRPLTILTALSDQARCVLENMPVDAFKIGLF